MLLLDDRQILAAIHVILVVSVSNVISGTVCPFGWSTYQSSCYKYVYAVTIDEPLAEKGCVRLGGHLTSIANSNENDFVVGLASSRLSFWIGLQTTIFFRRWRDSSSYSYDNWNQNQPSRDGQCVEVYTYGPLRGKWNDISCHTAMPGYVCKQDGYFCTHPDPNVHKGLITVTSSPRVSAGDIANFSCHDGYTLNGTSHSTCLMTTEWSPPLPQCVLPYDPCGDWIFYGSSCYKYFVLTGTSWYVAQLSCRASNADLVTIDTSKENDFVGSLANAEFWIGFNNISVENRYVWASGSTSNYTNWNINEPNDMSGIEDCAEVQVFSSCFWNDEYCHLNMAYVCERVVRHCRVLGSLPNGRFSTPGVSAGTVVTAECDEGYALVGRSQITCLSSGNWDTPIPRCQVVDCGIPPIVNGFISISNTTYNGVVRFLCQNGYELVGASMSVCQANGTWQRLLPECRAILCDSLSTPAHGSLQHSGVLVSSLAAIFSCEAGYYLSGSSFRVCMTNGSWSGVQPHCFEIPTTSSRQLTRGTDAQLITSSTGRGSTMPTHSPSLITKSKRSPDVTPSSSTRATESQTIDSRSSTSLQTIIIIGVLAGIVAILIFSFVVMAYNYYKFKTRARSFSPENSGMRSTSQAPAFTNPVSTDKNEQYLNPVVIREQDHNQGQVRLDESRNRLAPNPAYYTVRESAGQAEGSDRYTSLVRNSATRGQGEAYEKPQLRNDEGHWNGHDGEIDQSQL